MAEIKKLYRCDCCHQTMNADNFYKSNNIEKYGDNDGYLHLCKKCLTMHLDPWDPYTFALRKPEEPDKPCILEEIDVPWIPGEWNKVLAANNTGKVSPTAIFGKYLSKMKIKQHIDERYADTERIQQLQDNLTRASMKRQGFSASEIEQAIVEGRTPTPQRVYAEGEEPVSRQITVQKEPEIDLGLTEEDKMYLKVKWGNTYREDEWVQLERLYTDMMNSYDIQTAGHKDTLKLICKTSLKANQLIDIGDVDGYQKVSKVYDGLMKSGKFTAAQNKAEQGEYIDSISELVMICETDGFIPRYYVDEPKDKVDRVLQDLQTYTRSLIMEETNLGNMIDAALQQIQIDNEKASKINLDDADDDDTTALENELFNSEPITEDSITDEDMEDFIDWQNRSVDDEDDE